MKIGFTGTRKGMTTAQMDTIRRLIIKSNAIEAHMGDCIGADADFHYLVKTYLPNCIKIGYIPDKDKTRAMLKYDKEMSPKPYIARDKDIVDESDILIANPKGYEEELRSGTWTTVRYAKKKGKKVILVYPNGKIEESY